MPPRPHNPFADGTAHRSVLRAALALLAVAALAPVALAHPESAAPGLDARVLAAWHEPEPVSPGQQWLGYLRLRPEAAAALGNVSYQVCNVADGVCFSYPHPATPLGNGTYRFDTAHYLTNSGQPVAWEAGWRVGVRWFLADMDGNGTWLPPQGAGQAIEDSYLAFDIPDGAPRGAPAPTAPLLALGLLMGAGVARRGRRGA